MGDYIYIYIFNMNDAQMDFSNQISWLIGTLFLTHHLSTLFIREIEFIKKQNHTKRILKALDHLNEKNSLSLDPNKKQMNVPLWDYRPNHDIS